jgi:hypothetical protein
MPPSNRSLVKRCRETVLAHRQYVSESQEVQTKMAALSRDRLVKSRELLNRTMEQGQGYKTKPRGGRCG